MYLFALTVTSHAFYIIVFGVGFVCLACDADTMAVTNPSCVVDTGIAGGKMNTAVAEHCFQRLFVYRLRDEFFLFGPMEQRRQDMYRQWRCGFANAYCVEIRKSESACRR